MVFRRFQQMGSGVDRLHGNFHGSFERGLVDGVGGEGGEDGGSRGGIGGLRGLYVGRLEGVDGLHQLGGLYGDVGFEFGGTGDGLGVRFDRGCLDLDGDGWLVGSSSAPGDGGSGLGGDGGLGDGGLVD